MSLSNYFYYRRLIDHYEEEVYQSQTLTVVSFIMMTLLLMTGFILGCMGVTCWFLFIIPAFAFLCLGIVGMTNAANAKDMIEYIKWRM